MREYLKKFLSGPGNSPFVGAEWYNTVNRVLATLDVRTWSLPYCKVDRVNPDGSNWVIYVPGVAPKNVYKKQWDLFWTDDTYTQFYLADYLEQGVNGFPALFLNDCAFINPGNGINNPPWTGDIVLDPGPFTWTAAGSGLPARYVSPAIGSSWWASGFASAACIGQKWQWDLTAPYTSPPTVSLFIDSNWSDGGPDVDGFDPWFRVTLPSTSVADPATVIDLRGTARAYGATGLQHQRLRALDYASAGHTGFQPS